MRVDPVVFDEPDDLGAAAAAVIAERMASVLPRRPFLLGCPGGRSPMPAYVHLSDLAARRRLDLSRLVVVMMDEYVLDAGRFTPVNATALHSCRRFGEVEIVQRLNAGLPDCRRVPMTGLWLPDPADPSAYDVRIAAAGGVDLFLLASGTSDGHVAFNPPGSPPDSRTRIVKLPETTRRDNLATFDSFEDRLDRVPDHGVTVGIATIREQSKEVIMLCHGAEKGPAVEWLMTAAHYDPTWPATVLSDCRDAQLFVDRAAMTPVSVSPAPQRPAPERGAP